MRKNLIQKALKSSAGEMTIPNDWYRGVIPSSFRSGENIYIDSSYCFEMFNSENPEALRIGNESACYDRATFVTSGNAKIEIGNYVILNGCTLICSNYIEIGNYVMLAWGSVVMDNWLGSDLSIDERKRIMELIGRSTSREMPFSSFSPVHIEDNVWVGFDSVILPGTTIGRGSVIGCKSVVSGEIPPYSIITGNPGKITRTLDSIETLG